MNVEECKIEKIFSRKIWIEIDIAGNRNVMIQHEGEDSFLYCSFFYDYRHTDNVTIKYISELIAKQLGAKPPIETKYITDIEFNFHSE